MYKSDLHGDNMKFERSVYMKISSEFGFKEEIYRYWGTVHTPILAALAGITFPDPTYEISYPKFTAHSIEYIYEGSGAIQQDDQIYRVKAGDFFILQPEYVHYYSNPKDPWKKIWININGDVNYVTHLMEIFKIPDLIYVPDLGTPLELENIVEIMKADGPNLSEELVHHVFLLFQQLDHILKSRPQDSSVAARAKLFIDKRLRTKITVNEVAQYLSVSPDYLCRAFKKAHNIKPHDYIVQERIRQSKVFLKKTDISVTDIVTYFHFFDVPHFVRTFSAIVGCTPTEYRNKHRESNIKKILQKAHND